MPIELVDENGQEIDPKTADGSTLRNKLEETLAAYKELESKFATREAESVIAEKGYNLVTPDDLEGVEPDKIAEKAEALQQEKAEARKATVRSVFEERGLEGEDLDQAVETFLAGNDEGVPSGGDSDNVDFSDMTSIGGGRPSHQGDAPGIEDPMGNFQGHFENESS